MTTLEEIMKNQNPIVSDPLKGKGPYAIPENAEYVSFARNRIRFWEGLPITNHAFPIPKDARALYLPELHLHGGRHTQYGIPEFRYS